MSVCVCARVECEHPVGLVAFSRVVLVACGHGGNTLCCAAFTDLSLSLHKDKQRGCCLVVCFFKFTRFIDNTW